jgi:hypothetical protein
MFGANQNPAQPVRNTVSTDSCAKRAFQAAATGASRAEAAA